MVRIPLGIAALSIATLLLGSQTTAPALAQEALPDAIAQETMPDATVPDGAPTCGARVEIVKKLSKDFREAPMAVGMVDRSAVLEIFVSDEGTWTILATRTDGTSCIVSAGEGWQSKTLVNGRDA